MRPHARRCPRKDRAPQPSSTQTSYYLYPDLRLQHQTNLVVNHHHGSCETVVYSLPRTSAYGEVPRLWYAQRPKSYHRYSALLALLTVASRDGTWRCSRMSSAPNYEGNGSVPPTLLPIAANNHHYIEKKLPDWSGNFSILELWFTTVCE